MHLHDPLIPPPLLNSIRLSNTLLLSQSVGWISPLVLQVEQMFAMGLGTTVHQPQEQPCWPVVLLWLLEWKPLLV